MHGSECESWKENRSNDERHAVGKQICNESWFARLPLDTHLAYTTQSHMLQEHCFWNKNNNVNTVGHSDGHSTQLKQEGWSSPVEVLFPLAS